MAPSSDERITLISCENYNPAGQAREVVVAVPKENLTERIPQENNTKVTIDSFVSVQEVGNSQNQTVSAQSLQHSQTIVSNWLTIMIALILLGFVPTAAIVMRNILRDGEQEINF
jgi:hypothetical protein